MNAEKHANGSTVPPDTHQSLGITLLRVAWFSILLGFAMELLLLLAHAGFGDFLGLRALAASTVKTISWSTIVCVGLAIGTTVSRAQLPAMGLLGVLAAPLAFEISRVFHKGANQALSVAGAASVDASPVLLAFLKGVEYGCLGLAIAWLSRRPWGGAKAHIGAGLAAGLVFGGAILALTYWTTPSLFSAADFVARSLNEILFPVGCSLVLFSAGAIARKTSEGNE